MANCHDMKKDEIYECEGCGLQLRVVAECKNAGAHASKCDCHDGKDEECRISCCGHDLVKKA